jgi:hypothetical protein
MKRAIRACVLLAMIQPCAWAQQASPPLPPPPKGDCSAPEKRQLDFWVGHWDVSVTGKAGAIASSDIEALPGGCGISEHYDSPGAPGGEYQGWSYSSYDRRDHQWHQMYMDTNGNVTWYTGSLAGKALVMTAPGRSGSLQRMSYIPGTDGSVRQVGEVSTDAGATWQPGYDYTYRRGK